jgi:asparagine synthase (glutamine-hydrolysing)
VERLRRQGRSKGLRAYTIAYDQLIPHEERRWAALVAEHLGIRIDIVPVDGYRLYERWDDPAMHTPEPIDNPLWALPVDMCRRIAANGHRVALTGEAGDAACAPAQFLPELLAAGHWVRLFADALRFWRRRGRRPALGLGTWWRRTFGRPSEPPPFPTWINDSLVNRLGLRDRWREQWRTEDTAYEALASPEWAFCALTQHPSWTGVDLEFRYPFLDLRLVEFLLSVPAVPWADEKELLRVANEGRLPAEVLRRPKAPLTIDPVTALLRRDGIPPLVDADGWLWEFVDKKRFEEIIASGNWERGDITPALSLGRWLWHERQAGTLG